MEETARKNTMVFYFVDLFFFCKRDIVRILSSGSETSKDASKCTIQYHVVTRGMAGTKDENRVRMRANEKRRDDIKFGESWVVSRRI